MRSTGCGGCSARRAGQRRGVVRCGAVGAAPLAAGPSASAACTARK